MARALHGRAMRRAGPRAQFPPAADARPCRSRRHGCADPTSVKAGRGGQVEPEGLCEGKEDGRGTGKCAPGIWRSCSECGRNRLFQGEDHQHAPHLIMDIAGDSLCCRILHQLAAHEASFSARGLLKAISSRRKAGVNYMRPKIGAGRRGGIRFCSGSASLLIAGHLGRIVTLIPGPSPKEEGGWPGFKTAISGGIAGR
jgi:hypothetical protein